MTQLSMISDTAGQWEKPICLPHGLCWNCWNQSRKAEKTVLKCVIWKFKIKVHKHQNFTVLSSYPFSSSKIWGREG